MPTTDDPCSYTRADGIAPGRSDAFFRRIDLDEAAAETGDVESPLGHVMLVQATRAMVAEYVATAGDPWMSERRNFAPGWYIVRTDEHGFVWGLSYGGWCDDRESFCAPNCAEESARADFAEAEAVYAAWVEEVDE